MKVNKTFWIIFLILCGSLVGIFFSRSDLYYRLFYLSLVLILVSWVWAFFSVRGITVRRSARGRRQQSGQVFEEIIEVVNKAPVLRLWLEIRDESTLPGAAGSKVISWIQANEIRTYSAFSLLNQRGEFTLGPTKIYSGDPFGLFTFYREFPSYRTLLVLPTVYDLQKFPFPPGLLHGGRDLRKKSLEVTPHAVGVREYAPGDSLNRIHWPTTARRDKFMVKEFDNDPYADIWILLDAQKFIHTAKPREVILEKIDQFWLWRHRLEEASLPESSFEYAAACAASVAKFYSRQNRSVGFACHGQEPTVVSPERGERQLGKILETLAFLQPEGGMPLNGLVEMIQDRIPRGSTVVVVTTSSSSSMLLAVNSLLIRNLRPVMVVIGAESFGSMYADPVSSETLRARGIPVRVIQNGDNIRSVLEGAV